MITIEEIKENRNVLEEMKEAMKNRSYLEKWKSEIVAYKFRKMIKKRYPPETELQPEAERQAERQAESESEIQPEAELQQPENNSEWRKMIEKRYPPETALQPENKSKFLDRQDDNEIFKLGWLL